MAPKDDSSGPLFINSLYADGQIPRNIFSICQTPYIERKPFMTLGGFQAETDPIRFYDPSINKIVAHRISGSFHWELQMDLFNIGQNPDYSYRPKVRRAMTDTGTGYILIPFKDYIWIKKSLCDYI